jgi:hypothetical protein
LKREPTLIEFATAALGSLLLSAIAGLLAYRTLQPGHLTAWLPHAFRSSALAAGSFVAMVAIARRGTGEMALFGFALAIAVIATCAEWVSWWISGGMAPAFGGERVSASFADTIRQMLHQDLSLTGVISLTFIALANCLATLWRRSRFVGLLLSLGSVPAGILFVLGARYSLAHREASALLYLTSCVTLAVLLPLALRLVPRAFERAGLSPPPDPA